MDFLKEIFGEDRTESSEGMRLYFYGAGYVGRRMHAIYHLFEDDSEITAFIDDMQKDDIHGVPVLSFAKYLSEARRKSDLIIITTDRISEVEEKLSAAGISNYRRIPPEKRSCLDYYLGLLNTPNALNCDELLKSFHFPKHAMDKAAELIKGEMNNESAKIILLKLYRSSLLEELNSSSADSRFQWLEEALRLSLLDQNFELPLKLVELLQKALYKNFDFFGNNLNGFYREAEKRHKMNILPKHFYSPVPSMEQIEKYAPEKYSDKGLHLNEATQFQLLEKLHPHIREIYDGKTWADDFSFLKDAPLAPFDACLYYGMIRHLKPKLVIEIGAGSSTILARKALDKNASGKLFAIDPYMREDLKKMNLTDTLIEKPVQKVELEFFEQLGENDILFIDSSHVCSAGSDVTRNILEILPSLNRNVYIHFHDILLPYNFHIQWMLEKELFWNEQYLLHAFMLYNSDFEVAISGNHSNINGNPKIRNLYPEFTSSGSFWIKRTQK